MINIDISKNNATKQTITWINNTVIGCNFCPFAAKVVNEKSVRYVEIESERNTFIFEKFKDELTFLKNNIGVETTFIILTQGFENFDMYLGLIDELEILITKNKYEGVFQLASFHPTYCFAGSTEKDAANYTNRSPYPMLHILREDSVTRALTSFKNPELIPEKNIAFARTKGLLFMQMLMAKSIDEK